MSDQKYGYRVRPGYRHGTQNQYGPGDVVELTEVEAAGFLDKLELAVSRVDKLELGTAENAPDLTVDPSKPKDDGKAKPPAGGKGKAADK